VHACRGLVELSLHYVRLRACVDDIAFNTVWLQITREPGPVKGGKTHIAFAEDPTGYKFELIQRAKESKEPFAQVTQRCA
jgi:hypothetical protein